MISENFVVFVLRSFELLIIESSSMAANSALTIALQCLTIHPSQKIDFWLNHHHLL